MHGYLSDSKVFYKQLNFFGNHFEVFAPDLKGFGTNLDMEYPYSLSDYLDSVKDYMYKNSIICPHVIAHSFGGRIALKGASQNKLLFNKLVLTGCAGIKPKKTFKKVIKTQMFNILKTFCNKQKLERFYSSDYLSLNPIMRKSFIKIVNENLNDVLSHIDNECLLIFGKKDSQTPLYMAKTLNKGIKNSKLSVYNAGHFCFLDCSIKFNLEVREFLLS